MSDWLKVVVDCLEGGTGQYIVDDEGRIIHIPIKT